MVFVPANNQKGDDMQTEIQKMLIKNLTDNIVMLRSSLNLTQTELANIIGLSRHTLMAIEKKQREMTWITFLALVLVFIKNEGTNKLLNILEIYTDDLNKILVVEWNNEIPSEK